MTSQQSRLSIHTVPRAVPAPPKAALNTQPTDPVVSVQGLRKTYGAHVAVQDVSFSVQRGEIFGILGPNGAGKTTTVETLAGLRHADGGQIRILGTDPQQDPSIIRSALGIQLQESTLPPRMKVIEALRLYASFYPDPADPEELIEMLGLQAKRTTAFGKLSGGQKQRLSIALALIGNPQVAILDELTTGLDPQARRETWELIEDVRASGVTILLVTHFMDEAQRLCDRLVVIDQGRVVAQGSPRELTRQHRSGTTLRMLLPDDMSEITAALTALSSVTSVRQVNQEWEVSGTDRMLPEVIATLAERDVIPEEIRTLAPSLEDVFVDLVAGSAAQEVS